MDLNFIALIVGTIACSLGVISMALEISDWTIILFVAGFSNLIMSQLGIMGGKFLQEKTQRSKNG